MQNAASLYCTIKKIQRFEDRVIWRVYGRFSRTISAITPFFSPGKFATGGGFRTGCNFGNGGTVNCWLDDGNGNCEP